MRKELFPGLAENTVIFANFNQLYKIHIHRGRIADLFLDTPECNAHTTAADILWSGTPILTFPKYGHKMCSRVGASIAYATGHGNELVVGSEEEYEERAVKFAQGCRWEYVEDSVLKRQLGLANPILGGAASAGMSLVNGMGMLSTTNGHGGQPMTGVSGPMLSQPFHGASAPNGVNRLNPAAPPQFMQAQQQQQQQQQQPMVQAQQSVVHWIGHGPLMELRRDLWEKRDQSLLFDTLRWTRNLEKGLCEAWRRWETGQEFDELLESSGAAAVGGHVMMNGRRPSGLSGGASTAGSLYHKYHNGNIMVQQDGDADLTSVHNGYGVGYLQANGATTKSVMGANEGSAAGVGSLGSGPSGLLPSEDISKLGAGLRAPNSLTIAGGTNASLPLAQLATHPLSSLTASSDTISSPAAAVLPIAKQYQRHEMKISNVSGGMKIVKPSSNGSGGTFAGYGIPEGQIDPGQHGEPRRRSSSGMGLKHRVERLDQQIRRPDLGCIFVCD
ncbi:hypothetical protein BGZ70_009595 [Mortierella alpina]|uniref:O-GlcNAc transferase C-terminal domain-containing protein n=1 Tax=Mortierella alpina TaxID=64518 RepID=A0A9P6LZK6_MORAP|nr:hypothetical protein BGZ70_009595 [Mortierella alpina]